MTSVGTIYGQAIYDLALEEDLTDSLLSQLQLVEACFVAQPDYLTLLSCQALPKQERCDLLDESMKDSLHPYLLNFLKILVEKGYIRHFSQCHHTFRQCYYRDNGILPVTAVTALPLTEAQTRRLNEKLAAITQKSILLTNQVDKELLGGVRLDYDGKQLEDSISHRLEAVRHMLKNTVL